jgi:pyrophosphatase PpaX
VDITYDVMLFDLDGTLLDTNELIIESFYHVFDHDPAITRELVISNFGMPLEKQLLGYAGRGLDEDGSDLVHKYRTFNNANHDQMVTAFPGARETLQALREAGVRIGVVTSKIRFTSERGLNHCGLREYVETVITIEDVKKPKPDGEGVHLALERLGVKPTDRVLMVGDSPFDMGCARHAGVDSCAVAWSLKDEAVMRAENPTHTIQHLQDLLQWLPK